MSTLKNNPRSLHTAAAVVSALMLAIGLPGCAEVESAKPAADVNATEAASGFAMGGVVIDVSDDRLTLEDKNEGRYTVLVDDGTMYTVDGNAAFLGSIERGDYANVIVDEGGDKLVARAVDAVSVTEEK